MKAEILREGLRRIERVEEAYERLAKMLEPEGLEEDLLPLAKGCMAALRGLERCVEMRLKLAREEERGRAAEPEAVSEGEEEEGER
ncbi:hypothetical protein, partial [uncultured Rikenella sp.]